MAKKKSKPVSKSTKIENENTCAFLSYLLIGIIWYFADSKMNKSAFAKYHVKQAINAFLIFAVLNFILTGPLFFFAFFLPLLGLFEFVIIIIAIINAANGKKKEVLIVGQFAEKYLTF